MAFIKDLEKRIETEHKATLQQLDTEDTSALPVAFDQRQVDVVPTNLTINNRDSKRFGRSSLKSVMKLSVILIFISASHLLGLKLP